MEIKLPNEFTTKTSKETAPWLLAYSDMVTLLLAFFVLFFAISQVDQAKFEMIMEYFGENDSMPLHVLEEKFQELVKTNQLEENVEVKLTPDGLLVNFQDNVLFDSGKAELKSKSFAILNALSDVLKDREVLTRKIKVQGHTDSLPLAKNASYPSNWELSGARSASVIRYLISKGITSGRFVAIGYADTQPKEVESEQNRGLSVNRRVGLLIR